MPREGFFCEAPHHDGERYVRHSADQVIVTVDGMAARGSNRVFRIDGGKFGLPGHICKTCALELKRKLRGGILPGQEPLL